MVFVYLLAAIASGVAAVVMLWPAWGWGALLAAPVVASALVLAMALLLAIARR